MATPGTGPHPAAKLAVLMSGNVLMTFMISAVMPASRVIAQNFSALGMVDLHAQILLLAPYAALIFVAPLSGAVIRRHGRRAPLLLAIALYAVAGGAELFTAGYWPLVAERVLLGVGGGGITTICMTLAGDYFSGARQTWAVALVGMASAPGSVLVLLLSGVLVDWGGWHLAFAPYLLAFPVFIAALIFIDEPATLSTMTPTAGALPKFFWILCLITMFEACAAVLPAVQLPFLIAAIGITQAKIASVLIALSACVAVAVGSLYPIMRRHLSVNAILVMIFGLAAIAYVGFAVADNIYAIALSLCIVGVPVGLMIPHFSALAIERSTVAARGRAVGLVTSAIFVGQVAIPLVVAPLRATLGMKAMFIVLAAVLLAASILAAVLPSLGKVQRAQGSI